MRTGLFILFVAVIVVLSALAGGAYTQNAIHTKMESNGLIFCPDWVANQTDLVTPETEQWKSLNFSLQLE